MNAVSGIFVALALVFGGGYALDRIYLAVRHAAVERIHRGQPRLENFTVRLTHSRIQADGRLHPLKGLRNRE